MSGIWNPRGTPPSVPGTFAGYPQDTNKPTIQGGSWGEHVRYLEGVFYWCCGRTSIYVDPVGTPCLFTAGDTQATRDLQTFFGLTVDGVVGPQTWGVVDYVVYNAGMQ